MPITTVNFSVPEEVKQAFNETFAGENKSAIIAGLMQQAIEERKRQHRRSAAIDALLELRRQQHPVSDAEVATARHQGRP
jgi:metal-responsive CopG/Arc/MetJ family transcriptional regulator